MLFVSAMNRFQNCSWYQACICYMMKSEWQPSHIEQCISVCLTIMVYTILESCHHYLQQGKLDFEPLQYFYVFLQEEAKNGESICLFMVFIWPFQKVKCFSRLKANGIYILVQHHIVWQKSMFSLFIISFQRQINCGNFRMIQQILFHQCISTEIVLLAKTSLSQIKS